MPVRPRIEVEGAKQLRQRIRSFDKRVGDLKAAHKAAADVVAKQAKIEVPVRTGRLRRTVRSTASQTAAFVAAGHAGWKVRYAGPIHFGNPRKKGRLGVIRPQPFLYDAVDRRQSEVVNTYERFIQNAADRAGL